MHTRLYYRTLIALTLVLLLTGCLGDRMFVRERPVVCPVVQPETPPDTPMQDVEDAVARIKVLERNIRYRDEAGAVCREVYGTQSKK